MAADTEEPNYTSSALTVFLLMLMGWPGCGGHSCLGSSSRMVPPGKFRYRPVEPH